MKLFNYAMLLVLLGYLSGCGMHNTREEYEVCIWGSAVTGAAIGSVGAVAGSAGGAALGGLIGAFACGPVYDAEPAPAPAAPAEQGALDSDGDGVPDSRDWCPGTERGTPVDGRGCPLDGDGDGVPDHKDECPGTPQGVRVDDRGCPLSGETLMTLEGVNFAFDSDRLTAQSESVLTQAVRVLMDNPGVAVSVEGHTDSVGSDAYNQGLSERRAEAVRRYLVNHGIDAGRLSSTGYGESSPLASNSTAAGRARNRRVELVVR